MIVKVQQSIEPVGRVLIYNEAKTVFIETDDPETVASVARISAQAHRAPTELVGGEVMKTKEQAARVAAAAGSVQTFAQNVEDAKRDLAAAIRAHEEVAVAAQAKLAERLADIERRRKLLDAEHAEALEEMDKAVHRTQSEVGNRRAILGRARDALAAAVRSVAKTSERLAALVGDDAENEDAAEAEGEDEAFRLATELPS